MNQSMHGSWITGNLHGAQAPSGSISLRQAPSGSISLRQAPSGSVRLRGPPHLCPHPSTVNTPPPFQDRNAGADCPGAGCAVWDDHALLRRAATILYAHNGGSGLGGRDASTYTVVAQAMLVCAGAGNYNVHRPVLSRHEAGAIRVVTAPIGRGIAAPIRRGITAPVVIIHDDGPPLGRGLIGAAELRGSEWCAAAASCPALATKVQSFS